MEAKDVIQLLRLQRHDLMNDLQIVHGYLSMGKTDKVKSKVNDIINGFNQERKLMNINCPNFALWLIQVSLQHKHIQFTYDIHTENRNLHDFDLLLTDIGRAIIENINAEDIDMVTGEIEIRENDESIELVLMLDGLQVDINKWNNYFNENLEQVLIQAEEQEASITFVFFIPLPE